MADWLYLYALMRAEDAPVLDFAPVAAPKDGAVPSPRRIDVSTPDGRTFAAIVSPLETDEVLSTRRNMLAHARALELLMTGGPILPMRFGAIAAGDAPIRTTLAENAARIAAALDDLDGFVEIGVKISWNRVAAMNEVVSAEPELKKIYQSLAGRNPNETHYARVELGRRVEAALAAKRAAEQTRFAALLNAHARDCVWAEPDDEMMVLKADYLVSAAQETAFAAALEALEAEAPDRLVVKYVGPAPAYNFVDLTLDWSGAGGDAAEAA